MAACDFYRQDTLNTTTTSGKHVPTMYWSATENKVLLLWREASGIRFGKWDPITHTASGERQVGLAAATRDNPILIAVSDTHLFAIFYATSGGGFTARTVCCESTDAGDTWGAETAIGTIGTSTNDRLVGAYWDGTNIVVIVCGLSSGGVGAGDYGYAKSVGATNVWSNSTKFYEAGGAGSATPGSGDRKSVV